MESEDQYDAIIIGAGLNGLTIGNTLAYNGYKTIIIDKNTQPGGYVQNFYREEFRFDVSTQYLFGAGPDGIVTNILKTFGAENLHEFKPVENILHWKDTQNNYECKPPVAIDEFTEFIAKEFPEDEKNWRKFDKKYGGLMDKLLTMMDVEGKLRKVGWTFKNLGSLMKVAVGIFRSSKGTLNKKFKNPALRELLHNTITAFGISMEESSFLLWCLAELSYHRGGAWYPTGGGGAFSASLGEHFKKNGGELLLNHTVTSINVKKAGFRKKIADVVTCRDKKGNEKKFTGKIVVNACDLETLAKELVPEGTFKKRWIKRVSTRDTMDSMFCVYLGLDIDVRDYGVDTQDIWHIHPQNRTPEIREKIDYQFDYSVLPKDIITVYNNSPDDTACPPGESVISIYVTTKYDGWEGLLEDGKKGPKYKETKEKCGWQLVDRLAKIINIPDLRDHVKVMVCATPLTLKRFSGAKKGTPLGYRWTKKNLLPPIMWGTNVKNLYVSGQLTFPCGGMPVVMLTGSIVAKNIIQKLKKMEKKEAKKHNKE